jgi:hypothetical protein
MDYVHGSWTTVAFGAWWTRRQWRGGGSSERSDMAPLGHGDSLWQCEKEDQVFGVLTMCCDGRWGGGVHRTTKGNKSQVGLLVDSVLRMGRSQNRGEVELGGKLSWS